MQGEISQTEKDKYCTVSFKCGLKNPETVDRWLPEAVRWGKWVKVVKEYQMPVTR